MIQRVAACLLMATVVGISGGCSGTTGVSTTKVNNPASKPVVKDATREELLDKYNAMAQGVKTVNATVIMRPTAGSKYTSVIEEYHDVKAFLLAQRPANIRVIGQVAVIGTTVFDMASDGNSFRVSIPSKSKFLVGAVAVERSSEKPIENLRPQHLLEALLWPEIQKKEVVLIEEFNDQSGRYYVLTVLRGGYETEILRKIWFNRADLQVSRIQNFGPKGVMLSDVLVSDWKPVDAPANPPAGVPATGGAQLFPHAISIERPHDDYRLDMLVTKITLNEEIPVERFKLDQPAGSELVRVTDDSASKAPPKDAKP